MRERGLIAQGVFAIIAAVVVYWVFATLIQFYTPNAPAWFFWGAG